MHADVKRADKLRLLLKLSTVVMIATMSCNSNPKLWPYINITFLVDLKALLEIFNI